MNKRLRNQFFRVLLISLILMAAVVAGAFWFYFHSGNSKDTFNPGASPTKNPNIIDQLFSPVPDRTNFVLLGLDKDKTHTDIMVVGSFDKKTGQANLMSVPRDTLVTMPQERRDALKEKDQWTPKDGVMKLNQVYHYAYGAGKDLAIDYTIKQIEELLGIKIDYYGKVDLDAFKVMVDAMGGITFDVPRRMIYNDSSQNLHINLEPGIQTLQGDEAEQLVRFRKSNVKGSNGYADGDIGREKTQQEFLKAAISQMFSKESLFENGGTFLTTAVKYIDTNFQIAELPKYLPFIKNISKDKITAATMPNDFLDTNGQSYVVVKQPEAKELIDQMFNGISATPIPSTTAEAPISSKDKSIEVLNGGMTSGKAASVKQVLESNGFTVSKIGNYSDTKQERTNIYVGKDGMGTDLQEYFQNSRIVVDSSQLETGIDIKIVIGTDE